jgi:putative transposase
MARRAQDDCFVLELPLVTTPQQERVLEVRLDVARQVYNACLGEALRRLSLMRQSVDYQRARKLPKGRERKQMFAELRKRSGFDEYALHAYAKQFNHAWLGDHLDINTIQKLASRAFDAVEKYAYGAKGKPRFKGKRGLHSVEGKSNKQGIRFRDQCIHWLGLVLALRMERGDLVVAYGLDKPVKFCRVLRRDIRGKTRWYVQLVLKGKPLVKDNNKPGERIVGLDIGPSTIAAVDDGGARLERFCDELKGKRREIRAGLRQLDRSRRATNPDNYNEDGTIKKGPKRWVRSGRYRRRLGKLANVHRRLAEHRKALHGKLANDILGRGKEIRTEKLSYRAFQRNFGTSVGFRAPGLFVSMLKRKAESAGGCVEMLPTARLALSQTCLCGQKKKKKLSQRWHQCDCGVSAQRDLFSAFLARHVQGGQLDASGALESWPSAEPLLSRAASSFSQAARRNGNCRPRLPLRVGQSGSSAKDGIAEAEARDVVAVGSLMRESPREVDVVPVRTPWL